MELNRLNELGNFISHFKKVHAGNRAAAIAAARLEKADKFGQITPEALDREGKIDWEGAIDEGYEEILGEHGLGLLRTVLELDPRTRATCAQAAAHEWLVVAEGLHAGSSC